jgi:KDO2-lipid IV(A) lauroyltransferase
VPGASARAAYLAYRGGAEVARVLPRSIGRRIARGVSRAMTAVWTTRRRQVERNLARVARGSWDPDELHRASGRLFANYGQYWQELFRLRLGDDSIEADTDAEGYEHIAGPQREGHPVILALPHLGNWDAAGAWLARRGHRLTVVAEPLEPPELFEWFVEQRRALGMDVVALGPGATGALLRTLREGGVACLVCDRDLTGDGVEVELFGEATTMPGGPAVLALRTGAPIVPVGIYFLPEARRRLRIMAPVPAVREGNLRDDVQRVTQDLARVFEELISAAPDNWLMMQPVWRSDVVSP